MQFKYSGQIKIFILQFKLNFENHMTFESTFKVLDRENTV